MSLIEKDPRGASRPMTLGELLAVIPPAVYVFVTIDRRRPTRAEGTIYGRRDSLAITQELGTAIVTSVYPDRFGNRTAGGLAIFVKEQSYWCTNEAYGTEDKRN